jgi:hypothetical protein
MSPEYMSEKSPPKPICQIYFVELNPFGHIGQSVEFTMVRGSQVNNYPATRCVWVEVTVY